MHPLVRKPGRLLPRSFYERPTLQVAHDLLGAWICRRLADGEELRGRIVEVEAYLQGDPAAHGYRGPTPRNEVVFGRAGISYVYFIYGMYHCFNVVTESSGTPAAVLIRGLDRIEGANGPGRLCRELRLTRLESGLDVTTRAAGVWLEQGKLDSNERIMVSRRIGLSVAQEPPWRYFVEGSPGVSKHPINRTAMPEE